MARFRDLDHGNLDYRDLEVAQTRRDTIQPEEILTDFQVRPGSIAGHLNNWQILETAREPPTDRLRQHP